MKLTLVSIILIISLVCIYGTNARDLDYNIQQVDILSVGEGKLEGNGKFCKSSSGCKSGCCKDYKCSRKAKLNEPCTEDQIKGGMYSGLCDCEKGPCSYVTKTCKL